MFLNKNKLSFRTLLSASVLLLSRFSLATSTPNDDGRLSLTETYFEPKNIGFLCVLGGASHVNWVLTILDELADRGHNVTFFTKDGGTRFSKPYPRINTISFGKEPEYDYESVMDSVEEKNNVLEMFAEVTRVANSNWEQDYFTLIEYFKTNKIDTIICDSFLDMCKQAAIAADIPYIVTCTLGLTPDTSAPYINNNGVMMEDYTTEFVSLPKRFYDKFIFPIKIVRSFYSSSKELFERKEKLGITGVSVPADDSADSIKLLNSYFGMTPARPLGPLVEQVGPIIPRKYEPLNAELKSYLDNHKRVAYVSFGQHALPSHKTVRLILTALLEVYEAGDIDAIIWAGSMTPQRLPQDLVTSSGKSYSAADLLENKYSDVQFLQWVPQMAVLSHPSTLLFVSHGGFGSCIESIYSGVRTVFFPVYGDQPANALMVERAKIGGVLKLDMSISEAAEIIKKIVVDENGDVAKNLKRMQAIAQIRSRTGAKIGADVVEEVAFSHVDGKVPHRYEASRNMSFIKAHNIDLYAILAVIVSGVLSVIGFILYLIFKGIRSALKPKEKAKTQ